MNFQRSENLKYHMSVIHADLAFKFLHSDILWQGGYSSKYKDSKCQ